MACVKPGEVMHPAACLCVTKKHAKDYINTYNNKWNEIERKKAEEKELEQTTQALSDFWSRVSEGYGSIFGWIPVFNN